MDYHVEAPSLVTPEAGSETSSKKKKNQCWVLGSEAPWTEISFWAAWGRLFKPPGSGVSTPI